jgi:hypothetical protein
MSLKYLPLLGALAIAVPAHAITINMSDFTYGAPADVDMVGTLGSPSYSGAAGAFSGATAGPQAAGPLARLAAQPAAAPDSFIAWCAELTQTFSFGVTYTYSEKSGGDYFGAQKSSDLSRLFTAAAQNHFVFDSTTSAAMQAGIWEIIYETGGSFDLTGGTFKGTAEDPANQGALDTVNGFLKNLTFYQPDFQIEVLANDDHQDFLVATVPEPETWALLAAGLGAIGLLRRRRPAA